MSNEPPEVAVAALVEHAVDVGCSDLFFTSDDEGLTVKVRHLGLIRDLARLSEELGRRCQGHIKANRSVDWGERRRPLDGRWIYRRRDGRVTDLRIGVIPTLHGEDIAIRLLSRDRACCSSTSFGMTPEQLSNYETMIDSPGGLVLITGRPGRGRPPRSTPRSSGSIPARERLTRSRTRSSTRSPACTSRRSTR